MIVTALINNICIIISLSILYSIIIRRWGYGTRENRVLSGLLFGAVAVIAMMNPLVFSPGLIFDGRSIVISIAGFIGGWATALVASLLSMAYRVWLGGPGAIMGVSVITLSAIIGVAFHRLCRGRVDAAKPLHIIAFGVIVHIGMLAMTATLPSGMRMDVLLDIAMPVIVLYPLGTFLVCIVLLNQESRIRAEVELKKNESKYRELVEHANSIIFRMDASGKVTFFNEFAQTFFGLKDKDILGKSPVGRFIAERESTDRDLKKLIEHITEDPIRYVNVVNEGIRPGGQRVWIAWTNKPMCDDKGQLVEILCVGNDITDRRRTEEAYRKSEEQLRYITKNIGDVVWQMDADFLFTYASSASMRVFGYEPQEIVGKHVAFLLAPHSIKTVGTILAARDIRLERGIPQNEMIIEVDAIHKDGHVFPVEIRSTPVIDESGRAIQYNGITRDVTRRKRMEETLRETERRLIQAQTISHIGNWDLDIRDWTISGSEETFRIFGAAYPGSGAAPMPFDRVRDVVLPADREELDRVLEALLKGSGKYEGEYRILRASDGEPRTVRLLAELVRDPQGAPFRIVGTIQDITEKKRMEQERKGLEERLQRAEKMEAIGTLAGGVAHDLNNVLGVLVGYSELMREMIPAGDPLRKYADNIFRSGERGAAIIQDLLTLARRGVAISEVVHLNDIVSEYLRTPEFESVKAYHPQVTFRADLAEGLLNIKGSPVHLGKTVMNLVSNAAEAISGSGEVVIRTENRYLDRPIGGYDDVLDGDYVVLTVSDNGKGISPADMGKIFEPFYTKKVMGRSGTGLGLAVVWGTVKDHNGYIDVQSEEGRGSVFTLYFPVTRDERSLSGTSASPESYRGRGEKFWWWTT